MLSLPLHDFIKCGEEDLAKFIDIENKWLERKYDKRKVLLSSPFFRKMVFAEYNKQLETKKQMEEMRKVLIRGSKITPELEKAEEKSWFM